MSVTELETNDSHPKTRKRNAEEAEIEIDVDAPEPPSKKALRKAKKAKASASSNLAAEWNEQVHSPAKQDESRENSKRSEYGIWIGNLSFNTTKDDLLKFLTTVSTKVIHQHQITRVHLPQGPPKFGKPQNKGFAYIDFSDEGCVETALKLSECILGGRRVLIKNAKNFEGRPEQKKLMDEKPNRPPSRRIFVGNLDFTTTVEDLGAHFGVCGPIDHTHMATFEDSGKCKGYAWIDFEQVSSAEKAMQGWIEAEDGKKDSAPASKWSKGRIWLNKLRGRKLRMEYAEDKATRYEKRYGKNAKKTAFRNEGSKEDGIVEVDGGEDSKLVNDKIKTKNSRSQGKYSEDTVQRLTGAIVESEGQRTIFE